MKKSSKKKPFGILPPAPPAGTETYHVVMEDGGKIAVSASSFAGAFAAALAGYAKFGQPCRPVEAYLPRVTSLRTGEVVRERQSVKFTDARRHAVYNRRGEPVTVVIPEWE